VREADPVEGPTTEVCLLLDCAASERRLQSNDSCCAFVTHLRAGDDVRTVQGLSGHADVRTRTVYTHRTVLNKADEAYDGCGAPARSSRPYLSDCFRDAADLRPLKLWMTGLPDSGHLAGDPHGQHLVSSRNSPRAPAFARHDERRSGSLPPARLDPSTGRPNPAPRPTARIAACPMGRGVVAAACDGPLRQQRTPVTFNIIENKAMTDWTSLLHS
jgi:hypothetical protein